MNHIMRLDFSGHWRGRYNVVFDNDESVDIHFRMDWDYALDSVNYCTKIWDLGVKMARENGFTNPKRIIIKSPDASISMDFCMFYFMCVVMEGHVIKIGEIPFDTYEFQVTYRCSRPQ